MGTSLQDIVLEVVLVLQQKSDGFALFCKFLQAVEVPAVQLGEVVFRHTVPRQVGKTDLHTTGAGKGLLIEGSPGIAILAADALVVVAAAVFPYKLIPSNDRYLIP